jgi:hypothetical protein
MLRTGHARTPGEEAPETVPPGKEPLGEDRPPEGPEEVVERFVEAMDAAEWDNVAALLDPVAVAWWHYQNLESLEGSSTGPRFMDSLPHQLEQFGVDSVEEFRHLTPARAAVRQLEAWHRGREGMGRRLRGRIDIDGGEVRVTSYEPSLVGTVEGSDGIAYAVVLDPGGRGFGPPERAVYLLVLRETDQGWRVMAEKLLMGTFRPFPLDEMPPSSGPE